MTPIDAIVKAVVVSVLFLVLLWMITPEYMWNRKVTNKEETQ